MTEKPGAPWIEQADALVTVAGEFHKICQRFDMQIKHIRQMQARLDKVHTLLKQLIEQA